MHYRQRGLSGQSPWGRARQLGGLCGWNKLRERSEKIKPGGTVRVCVYAGGGAGGVFRGRSFNFDSE